MAFACAAHSLKFPCVKLFSGFQIVILGSLVGMYKKSCLATVMRVRHHQFSDPIFQSEAAVWNSLHLRDRVMNCVGDRQQG